jgi:hypothetical protein
MAASQVTVVHEGVAYDLEVDRVPGMRPDHRRPRRAWSNRLMAQHFLTG